MTKLHMKNAAKAISALNKGKRSSRNRRATLAKNQPIQDDDGHFNPTTIIVLNQCPVVHVHSHEETFFELFYDLIIVVVLMKLSYLKYDFTLAGWFGILALFANFWSLWALFNVYVTMVHQEDGLHRLFYALHVIFASVMCIFTEHPEHSFFSFSTQSYYFILTGICSRGLIMIMYGIFYYHDGRMRKDPEMQQRLPVEYKREDVSKQVIIHVSTMFVSCFIFAITAFLEADAPCHRTGHGRYLASYSSYSSYGFYGDDDHKECDDHKSITHIVTIILWIIAIVIEQSGNFAGAIFGPLPFNGEYGGKRMQAWLMVCFGESVIGLLINPSYFDSVSLHSIMASLVMVFCLVTVYFDIVDADQFLHLFILRKEKWKAFFYCFGHWPFSMSVFFVGVALKIINSVMLAVHDLEVSTGCRDQSHYNARRLSLEEEQIKDVCSRWSAQSFVQELDMMPEYGNIARRRLAEFTLEDYDEIMFKSFLMLCLGVVSLQAMSMVYAYAMPTDQDICTLHCSRLGSVLVVSAVLVIPFNIKSVKSRCLQEFEIYQDSTLDDEDFEETAGLSPIEAVIATALIVMASFLVALFSIDVERSHTYKELEEAAHEQRKAVLDKASLRATLRANLNASRITRLQSTMNMGSFRMSAADFSRVMNGTSTSSGISLPTKSSFRWFTTSGPVTPEQNGQSSVSTSVADRARATSFDAGSPSSKKRPSNNFTGIGSARVGAEVPSIRSVPNDVSMSTDCETGDNLAEINKIRNRFTQKPIPPEPSSPSKQAFQFEPSNEIAPILQTKSQKRRLTPVLKFNGGSVEESKGGLPSEVGTMVSGRTPSFDRPPLGFPLSKSGGLSISGSPSVRGMVSAEEPSEPPPTVVKPQLRQFDENDAAMLFGANPKTRHLRMTS